MNSSTTEAAYHSAVYSAAGTALMDFKPIKQIHQHLCAFHVYAHDRTRHIEAHHYCTHLSEDLHQCIIYDSDRHDAKLIGIEYIITEEVFSTLSEDEKKYWHSHNYEVTSGLLQIQTKSFFPGMTADIAERPAMMALQKTYGKTIHTWEIDKNPDLPLGPPHLMMSYTRDGQIDPEVVSSRDERLDMFTEKTRRHRKDYLPPYEPSEGADTWEKTQRGIRFKEEEVKVVGL